MKGCHHISSKYFLTPPYCEGDEEVRPAVAYLRSAYAATYCGQQIATAYILEKRAKQDMEIFQHWEYPVWVVKHRKNLLRILVVKTLSLPLSTRTRSVSERKENMWSRQSSLRVEKGENSPSLYSSTISIGSVSLKRLEWRSSGVLFWREFKNQLVQHKFIGLISSWRYCEKTYSFVTDWITRFFEETFPWQPLNCSIKHLDRLVHLVSFIHTELVSKQRKLFGWGI